MAYGDVGGPVTTLIITCKTSGDGPVDIHRGDAVKLTGPYEVSNELGEGARVFGQALADCARNDAAIPVRVRGICDFAYSGAAPEVDGLAGVVGIGAGKVEVSGLPPAVGLVVKVDVAAQRVETLL